MANWWPFGRAKKENPVGTLISAYNVGQPVWTDRRYDKLAEEAYRRNAVAFRCIKLIAESAASVPWKLYNGRDEIENSPLLDLLNNPSPMVGGHEFFEAVYAYLIISGNSYIAGDGMGDNVLAQKAPKEIYTFRPDRTRIVAGPYGRPVAYEYEANGQKKIFRTDPITGMGPILHLKEFNPTDDWYGMGRTDPAAYGIDRHNASSAHNKALLDNGARPSGALVLKPIKSANGAEQAAPQAVVDAAIKDLRDEYVGPRKAGKPMVFNSDVDWVEMGLSPKDMDFSENKADAARDICTSYGVPHILVVPGDATYNNIKEARQWLWTDTIVPIMDRVVDGLNAWLTPLYGDGLRLGIDLDSVDALEPIRESKRNSVLELFKSGLIDRDEGRETLGFDDVSEDAVTVDPSCSGVITALANAAASEPGMVEPLFRYLESIGLVSPGTTLEAFSANWNGKPTNDDIIAALGNSASTQNDGVQE